jgi:hypothetical protein
MLRLIKSILLISLSINIISQSSSDQFINSSAGNTGIISNGYEISWTMGELVVETGIDYTQGFHQPNLLITLIENQSPAYNINIYPNPAIDFLNISSNEQLVGCKINLVDFNGKLILEQLMISNELSLPFNNYSTGTYLLTFINQENEILKTFKIQKSH